jgi:ferredoxin
MRRAADTMVKTSLCGLGQAASNPVSSSLRYFMSEYEKHITDKYCPSAVCNDLFNFYITPDRCTGCTLCLEVCSENAIQGSRKQLHVIDQAKCIKCRACVRICARNAIVGVPIQEADRLVFAKSNEVLS